MNDIVGWWMLLLYYGAYSTCYVVQLCQYSLLLGDEILTSGGYISLTPVQVYCIQRRLQIPMEETNRK